jgi:hypothetical protein
MTTFEAPDYLPLVTQWTAQRLATCQVLGTKGEVGAATFRTAPRSVHNGFPSYR